MLRQKYNKDFMVPLIGTLSRNPELDDSIIPREKEPGVPEEERKERVRKRTKAEERFEERNFHEYMKDNYSQTQIIETIKQLRPYVPSRIFNATIFAKQNFIRVTPEMYRELKAQVFDLSPDVIADMEHEYNVASHAKGYLRLESLGTLTSLSAFGGAIQLNAIYFRNAASTDAQPSPSLLHHLRSPAASSASMLLGANTPHLWQWTAAQWSRTTSASSLGWSTSRVDFRVIYWLVRILARHALTSVESVKY
ncbi:hypothetical protein PAPYR_1937 [Paratrimastix pyriformis]|uniref:Uncharacterized protein n=1 Tax=Paratrimastix pyriformis TaxID=342808 RepID=A0ABQ8UUP1_9EUKA|nr:hypothetical protein PAPYR_1937 [Paratrimastix pyriformis]